MERYLTQKGKKRSWWEIPALCLSLLFAAACVSVIHDDIVAGKGRDYISALAYATTMALTLLPMFFTVRCWLRRGQARAIAAALAKCDADELSLIDLDRVTGRRNAAPRVSRLLRRGYLTRASFTPDGLTLMLDNPGQAAVPEASPAQEAPDDPVLARIRALNDAIDDDAVSGKIERIEALTAGIFRTMRQRPERADDARRFMNYYLPTTLRLLESYSLMEKQSYQGENIRSSRKGIETALDKLIVAIEVQQDRLFRAEAMDVEAEIRVLETLMRSEGTSV